ncbi:MAG: Gmad2 immunoglobulin-like domain-containing protein [Candidatus Saccharibacteria bacterium]
MAKSSKRNNRSTSKPKVLMSLGVVVGIALVVVIVLELTNTIHILSSSKPASQTIVTAGNPSPAASNNSSSGQSDSKTANADNTQRSIEGVTDTNGNASASTNSSQWVSSTSGVITVKQPIANASVQSGFTLSGSATVSQINYTLIDNSVGVISEGTLNVVNGNFSGNINFSSHSSSGRLDVYSTSTPGGAEQNEIEISVSY